MEEKERIQRDNSYTSANQNDLMRHERRYQLRNIEYSTVPNINYSVCTRHGKCYLLTANT